jgi:hypothetical protein
MLEERNEVHLLIAYAWFTLVMAAQSDVRITRGNEFLHHGLIDAAQAECDAAFRSNPSDPAAGLRNCHRNEPRALPACRHLSGGSHYPTGQRFA